MSKQSAKTLSTVKGLGATKVTSLVDAFTKPFLVGGLKRGVAFRAVDSTTSIPVDEPNVNEPKEAVEEVGSPDWPEDESDKAADEETTSGRGRERVRSRSVEEGAVGETGTESAGVGEGAWKDPLDDDDDEEEEEDTAQPRKKARVNA
jgi:DNA excision repair protein ERCC-1